MMKYFYDPASGGLFNDKSHTRHIPDGFEVKAYMATRLVRKGLKKVRQQVEFPADTPKDKLPPEAEPFMLRKYRTESLIPAGAIEISAETYNTFIQSNGQKRFDKKGDLIDVIVDEDGNIIVEAEHD